MKFGLFWRVVSLTITPHLLSFSVSLLGCISTRSVCVLLDVFLYPPADKLSLYHRIYIGFSYVLLLPLSRVLGWLAPSNYFNPPYSAFVCPRSAVCNSVVVFCCCTSYVLFVHYLYINEAVSFPFELFYIWHFGTFYRWHCGMGFAHSWMPCHLAGLLWIVVAVSCGELSHWKLYHIFLFLYMLVHIRFELFQLFISIFCNAINIKLLKTFRILCLFYWKFSFSNICVTSSYQYKM